MNAPNTSNCTTGNTTHRNPELAAAIAAYQQENRGRGGEKTPPTSPEQKRKGNSRRRALSDITVVVGGNTQQTDRVPARAKARKRVHFAPEALSDKENDYLASPRTPKTPVTPGTPSSASSVGSMDSVGTVTDFYDENQHRTMEPSSTPKTKAVVGSMSEALLLESIREEAAFLSVFLQHFLKSHERHEVPVNCYTPEQMERYCYFARNYADSGVEYLLELERLEMLIAIKVMILSDKLN